MHYFDDLNAQGAEQRVGWHRELMLHWVHENPPGRGTGWEPYPTSLRIVNWLKWALAGNVMHRECLHSLAVQTRWLARRLEIHLLGNHLFVNAKALVFAGLFFEGKEAEQWLEMGRRILGKEIPEQILADGGHFERSAMYHAMALEDMLDLLNVFRAYGMDVPVDWLDAYIRMRSWLKVMTHPDGDIALFNDAAFGIAPTWLELDEYAARLWLVRPECVISPLMNLPETGYIRCERAGEVLLLDVGLVGPDYLAGHAHADTLSFELSLFGQRVIVDSGTSTYEKNEERQRQRGTAAHNTAIINGKDSSEVWNGFRVARRAYPILAAIQQKDNQIIVEASHDGYWRLPGKNIHRRKWIWEISSLTIEDEVTGSFTNAEARFHLHPDIIVDDRLLGEGRLALLLSQRERIEISVKNGILSLDPTTWHSHFGVAVSNICLTVSFQTSRVTTLIKWHKSI
jgi:uncharacterized heparinase superfamily protein